MIDWTEISNGDDWELFARDFLAELGFVIEIGPGRGADGGRDLLVSEQLTGKLATKKFTWLVSCKHNANSGTSVGPADEQNILDRINQHNENGFLGFYSTLPSAALIDRLRTFTERDENFRFEIFDSRKIEGHFLTTGHSKLALRYFPKSYDALRPIQSLFGKYQGLECEICQKDILRESVRNPGCANILFANKKGEHDKVESIHVVCKGECDKALQASLYSAGLITAWRDLRDFTNPILYLKHMIGYMNNIFSGPTQFTPKAHEKMKDIYISFSQRTLREISHEDRLRFEKISELDEIGI